MAYRTKLPPMRLVVSVVAVLLVAVAIPLSTAFADGMNGMIGEKQWTKNFDSLDDYQSNVPIYKVSESNYGPVFSYAWKDGSVPNISPQMIITPSVNGNDYSELVISNEHLTNESVAHLLSFQLDYSPEKWLADGAKSIDIDLAMESEKTIRISSESSYSEHDKQSGWAPIGLVFSGVSDGRLIQAHVPIYITSENEEFVDGNLINVIDEFRTYSIAPKESSDIIRAMTYLKECDHIAMVLTLSTTISATGDLFENGDYLKYRISVIGDTVSGYAVSNIFVGILGVGLIVGAVFATPWVGRNTFSKDSRLRRGGRRVYQGARRRYSNYKSKRRSGSKRRRW